jgi:hypothetical protein
LLLPRGGIDDGLGTRARLGRGLLLSLPDSRRERLVSLRAGDAIRGDSEALLELGDRLLRLRAEVAIDSNLEPLGGEELLQGANVLAPRANAEEWQVFHRCGILSGRRVRR